MRRETVIRTFRAAQRAGLTAQVLFDGLSLTGTLNTAREEVIYTAYGSEVDYSGSVLVVADDLPKRPRRDDVIKVGGSVYRVVGVRDIDTVVTAIDYREHS